jgi:pimeloyl-ACP methyl ester carboxylesterase
MDVRDDTAPAELVDLGGRRLECRLIDGDPDRPALVFLHEGLGSVALWRDFPARVAEASGRRVLVYSRFGHGASDLPGAPRTPGFMHEEALEVLPALRQRFDLRDPILVGHSDGGSIALIHAGRVGGVSALVLLAPHVFVEDESIAGITAAKHAFQQGDLARRMARYHRDPEVTFRGWNDVWLSPEFRAWNIEDVLGGVACPVLLVQGENDQYGTLEQVRAIERGIPGPVETVVLDCKHVPHAERPEETLGAVTRFLAALAVDP